MNWLYTQSKLQRLVKHRNVFMRLAFYELGIIALLIVGLCYAFTHQRIVVTPAVIERSFWVGHHDVSADYLAEMTNFFIGLRFNLSPSNVVLQRDILLRYTAPSAYEILKRTLVSEADRVSKQAITLAFYPTDIQVNTQTLTARVIGDLITTVSGSVLPSSRLTLQVHYTYHDGRLLVKSFDEVKTDAT